MPSATPTIPGTTPTPTSAPGVPTPTPTPTPTQTPTAPPKPIVIPTPLSSGQTIVGYGFSDVSPHQIVRSSANVLYVSVPTCNGYPNCYANVLPMYVATSAGTASGFFEADAAHRPFPLFGAVDTIESSAIAIGGNDLVYVAYITKGEGAFVATFDARANRWFAPVSLGATVSGIWGQGREGIGIAVDASGAPHVVWSYVGSDTRKHVAYANRTAGAWTAALRIDDAPLGNSQGAIHPAMAFAPDGTLLVAWLVGNEGGGYNVPDGSIYVRASRSGAWSPSARIPDVALGGNPGYAQTSIDQGPSIMVTANGTAHVTYLDTNDAIRYWYSPDLATWRGDRQPATQLTHNPSLGPDGSGGVFIYGHGTPYGSIAGHGNNLYRMHLAAGTNGWTAFGAPIVSDNNVDCSVSTRWSQFFHYYPSQIDFTYWHDTAPNFQLVGQR